MSSFQWSQPSSSPQTGFHAAPAPRVEPHRGGLIQGLGIGGTIFSFAISCMFPALAMAGLAPCLAAIVMARADLAKMDAGTMDPVGRSATVSGKRWGYAGAAVSLLVTLLTIGLVVAYVVFFVAAVSQQGG